MDYFHALYTLFVLVILGGCCDGNNMCYRMSAKCIKQRDFRKFVEDEMDYFHDGHNGELDNIACVPCCADNAYEAKTSGRTMEGICYCEKIQKPKHMVGCAFLSNIGEKMIRMEGRNKIKI